MAGIGFRLQKLLDEDTYTSTLKAYAYSAIIMAGPLILTILTICLINWVSLENLTFDEQAYLRSLITYCFAFSLVAVGPAHLVITRFLADEYYRKHTTHYTAAYFASVGLHGLIWGPVTLFFLQMLSISWTMRLYALLLLLFILGIWLALVFLSAARDYMRPVRAFLFGSAVSLGGSYLLGVKLGLTGYFGGFVVGQGLTFFLLSASIIKEYGYQEPRDYFWLSYFKRYPYLMLTGLFYNLGIWVDKFFFWASPEAERLDKWLRTCTLYDGPMFLAYLTILPSLAYFLIRMETDFFFKYQSYYRGIAEKQDMEELEKRRVRMIQNLTNSIKRLVIFQCIVSGLSMLAVPWVTFTLRMDPIYMSILRIGILAAFLQVGYLIFLNLILYFDDQRSAMITSLVFFISNGLFSYLSLSFGLPAYGFGYTIACFLALLLSFFFLNNRLYHLHFWTFMKQPLFKPTLVTADDD